MIPLVLAVSIGFIPSIHESLATKNESFSLCSLGREITAASAYDIKIHAMLFVHVISRPYGVLRGLGELICSPHRQHLVKPVKV